MLHCKVTLHCEPLGGRFRKVSTRCTAETVPATSRHPSVWMPPVFMPVRVAGRHSNMLHVLVAGRHSIMLHVLPCTLRCCCTRRSTHSAASARSRPEAASSLRTLRAATVNPKAKKSSHSVQPVTQPHNSPLIQELSIIQPTNHTFVCRASNPTKHWTEPPANHQPTSLHSTEPFVAAQAVPQCFVCHAATVRTTHSSMQQQE